MDIYNSGFSWGLFTWQMIILISLFLWFYCLADVLKSRFGKTDKLILTLVVLFIPLFGSIVYLLVGHKKKLEG